MKRWLHISDLHFNSDDMSTSMLREELPKFLKKKNFSFDYIFCTGDIRTAPEAFPVEAAEYLKDLCRLTKTPFDNLFIVPGNHDVNRVVPGRDDAIKRVCFKRKGYYDPKYGLIKDSDIELMQSGLNDFKAFLGQIYTQDRVKKYSNPHFIIETEDFNVLHVDTTLSYTAGQEANDLIIGTNLLRNALSSVNSSKPIILITHFPFTSLLQEEKKYVGELLYAKGVRLWLAGHEHDHILQPMGYLSSIQAGELRMEERTSASILVGEYEDLTGTIEAYTWFPEGWAKYPIINHDSVREDQFRFSLKLPEDNGQSREKVKSAQANEEFLRRLPETVIEELLPTIQYANGQTAATLSVELINIWNTDTPHLILRADGGMGKSTMMLDACRREDLPVLYIPVERLDAIGITIKTYCIRVLFDEDEDRFNMFVSVKYTTPSLILFIDGLNEVDASAERRFINEIKGINLLKGIQLVVSSRSDFTMRYSMCGYRMGELQPVSDMKLRAVFSEAEWKYISDTVTLHRLLTNPMMITMYKEISPIIEQNRDVPFLNWITPIKNSTDLLHNYYVSQIAVMIQRTGVEGSQMLLAAQIFDYVLPALGYAFETSHILNMKNDEFRELIKYTLESYQCSLNVEPIQEFYRYYDVPELKQGPVIDFLIDSAHMLYRDSQLTTFPHQIYRDYLSACWIVKKTEEQMEALWNSRGMPFPIMEHIRNMSGTYWNGIAAHIHDAGKNREDAYNLVGNLLDCFPVSDTSGTPDYSDLNLKGLRIPDTVTDSERILLKGTSIDEVSIGKINVRPRIYTCLQFSPDSTFLACVANGTVHIYELGVDKDPYSYHVYANITKLLFEGKYLFAVANDGLKNSITAFVYDKEWDFAGETHDLDNWHIFNNRLKSIILKEDVLYFYYNNREQRYQLPGFEKIYNKQKKHAWENPVDGVAIDMSVRKRKKIKRDHEIVDRCSLNDLTATSLIDGSLVIKSGNEIQFILDRGVTLLKDGSIAGNGSLAVTLSFDLFHGQRKVQIWNLNEKRRTGEVFCPGEIERIHLSDTGAWIFGETDTSTWVYEIENNNSFWYSEHFISNQHGKLTSYGDKVLRKNNDNLLFLYNLKTKESEELNNPCKNARIACFMPDGSVAMVGNNARKLKFRNSRTGEQAEIDSKSANIIGIQSLKNRPFIAVATDDRKINIYHTGDCLCKRHLDTDSGNYMMVVHPELNVVANSDGSKRFEIQNYYEKNVQGQLRGWWYTNQYGKVDDPAINGDVLDIAFNTDIHELVVILTTGQILFCHEKYCRYHGKIEIITSFNVDAYDFRGCFCEKHILEQLRQNGALIEENLKNED